MKTLSRHAIDAEHAIKQVEMCTTVLHATLGPARQKPQLLNQLLSVARDQACALSVVDPHSPEICTALRLGAEAAAAIFAAAAATSGTVRVDLGGGPSVELTATGPNDLSHVINWRLGFFLAAMCRDLESLDILSRFPVDILRRSSTKGDECLYRSVEVFQALWRRDQHIGSILRAALEETDPSRLRITPEEFVLNLVVPELDMVFGLLANESSRFNESLAFALERHKKYWNKGNRKRDPEGWLALGPLALASFACDADKTVEVESEYLSMAIVRGGCSLDERAQFTSGSDLKARRRSLFSS